MLITLGAVPGNLKILTALKTNETTALIVNAFSAGDLLTSFNAELA